MNESKIIWSAIVIDVNDPLMLNRVRVNFNVKIDDKNNEEILRGVPSIYKLEDGSDLLTKEKWGKNDPFCFLPLLPIFLNITPKEKEYVNIIWPNPSVKFGEQYYIQGTFSSPLSLYKQSGEASRMFATKDRIVDSKLLKNQENNKYWNPTTKGVFIEPEDMGIAGRGTCDLVVKDNQVLLRAGKSKTLPNSVNSSISVKNTRSFLELSDFDVKITDAGTEEVYRIVQDVSFIKTLIEWEITNPDNQHNSFGLIISLYRLAEDSGYTTDTLKVDTVVPTNQTSLIYRVNFGSKTIDNVIDYINTFIQQVNDGEINLQPFPICPVENQFPCYFRPAKNTAKWLSISPSLQFLNIEKISNGIQFLTQKRGFGLIFSNGLAGQQSTIRTEEKQVYDRELGSRTYGVLAGDRLLLLSHESKIPSKQQIVMGDDTVYGLTQDFIVKNIIPNTDSFVRGEQLMKFMNLVIRFLVGHVHAFPGLPPVPVSIDGVSAQQILIDLQNAPNTILNQNIRIN